MSKKRLTLWLVCVLVLLMGVVSVGYAADTGQVRLAQFVFDGAPVDLIVDGTSFISKVAVGEVSSYIDVAAGEHQITIVPSWEMSDAVVASPTSITVEAGKNYAVALVGQTADQSIKPLIIDESEAFKDQDLANQSGVIIVNNLKGAPALDAALDDSSIAMNVAYGDYGAGLVKSGNYDQLIITGSGDPSAVFSPPFPPGEVFVEPGVVILAGMMGSVPGDFGGSFTMGYQSRTSLPVSRFLAGFSGRGIGYPKSLEGQVPFKPQIYSFDTLLAALDKAGLKDMVDQGSYILFAPTDEAFAALPPDTLARWMADPQELTTLLRYHIAEGALSAAELAAGKSLTTLSGAQIQIGMVGDSAEHLAFGINGNEAGCGCNYWAANNNRIFVIDTVLMPPAS